MTTPSTEELIELLEKATPGPWIDIESGYSTISEVSSGNLITDHTDSDFSREQDAHNAALIVAAVNALPGLLAENERLKGDTVAMAANKLSGLSDLRAQLTEAEAAVQDWKRVSQEWQARYHERDGARPRTEAAEAEVERLEGDVANLSHSITLREQLQTRCQETQAHTERLWNAAEARALTAEAKLSALGGGAVQSALEGLRLIAEGWAVIESDGRKITIEPPEYWDGPKGERIVDTSPDLALSTPANPWRPEDRDAVVAYWQRPENRAEAKQLGFLLPTPEEDR